MGLAMLRTGLLGIVGYQLVSGLLLLTEADGAGQQAALLVHLVLGVLLLFLIVPYLRHHLPRVWKSTRQGMRLLGAGSTLLLVGGMSTGTWMLFRISTEHWISDWWREWHRYLALAGGVMLVLHLGIAARRKPGRMALRDGLRGLLGALAAGLAILTVAVATGDQLLTAQVPRGDIGEAPPPHDGSHLSTTGRFWDRPPPVSQTCGTAGCHPAIYDEWRQSPHGQADKDPYYLALEQKLRAGPRAERVRYCNECHDPELLVTGGLAQLPDSGPVVHSGQGVSCVVCHSMAQTNGKLAAGNLRLAPPRTALAEESWIGRILIRAYPAPHKRAYSDALYDRSRLCAGCHRASVSEDVPGYGLFRIDNPYSRWELSRVKVQCQDCHMPPSEGLPDQYHASHRFPGAATHLDVSPEQKKLVESLISGDLSLPNVRNVNSSGRLFKMSVGKTRRTSRTMTVPLIVSARSRIGHQFPAGASDLVQVWIEAELIRDGKHVLARWGEVEPGGPLFPGTPIYRRRHLRRRLPGQETSASPPEGPAGQPFGSFREPGDGQIIPLKISWDDLDTEGLEASGGTEMRARLWYRKIHQNGVEALGTGVNDKKLPLPPRLLLAETKAAVDIRRR